MGVKGRTLLWGVMVVNYKFYKSLFFFIKEVLHITEQLLSQLYCVSYLKDLTVWDCSLSMTDRSTFPMVTLVTTFTLSCRKNKSKG